jgi:hypothetical protein
MPPTVAYPFRKKPMRKSVLFMSLFLLAACSRNKPTSFSGPARENGLECALRVATDSGFAPERGGLTQGFVYLNRDRDNSIGEKAKEAAARIATLGQKGVNRMTADKLNIVGADMQLRITASSIDERGREVSPTEDAERIGRFILRSCAPV